MSHIRQQFLFGAGISIYKISTSLNGTIPTYIDDQACIEKIHGNWFLWVIINESWVGINQNKRNDSFEIMTHHEASDSHSSGQIQDTKWTFSYGVT